MTFHVQIITLYADMFRSPLGVSLAGRALEERKWFCPPTQLRDFATDKRRAVDFAVEPSPLQGRGGSRAAAEGKELGFCIAVENFGAGNVIEVERPDGKRFMVPMKAEAVPEWGERIVIDAAFAG